MISKEIKKAIQKGSGIRLAFHEARRQEKEYGIENVFDLSIGNPSAKPPQKVNELMRQYSSDESLSHCYMSEAGYESVREEIATAINAAHQTEYSFENVIMTTGVAGGLNVALKTLINPGDEVIIFRPYYPSYIPFVENFGGVVKIVDSIPETFQADLAQMKSTISKRTKVVLINSPHNPTGAIYDEKTAKEMTDILKQKEEEYQHGICLLSDEPYRELNYTKEELPWWPDYFYNTIVCYSYSKSLSLAGERIGYVLVPDEMENSENVIQGIRISMGRLGYVNAPAFFQRIVGECAREHVNLEYYKRNREIIYSALKRLGFECSRPQGAFYVFLKVPGGDEEQFMELAKKRHLIFVGGKSFGMEGYVRVSFCCDYQTLERAVPALEVLAQDCGINGGTKEDGEYNNQ